MEDNKPTVGGGGGGSIDNNTVPATTPAPPPVSIPKETIDRLLKDIRDMVTSSLEDEGIYYKHSETDILKAYVMIVGPPDSLYFGGYYFFQINFPVDYPHSPPVVTYLTNDGITRFHPNFYKSGKICLSIFNTWRGEQWTSCQTIKSCLLTMLSIMDSKPLLHEPGIKETHNDYNSYHIMILYKNIDFSCIQVITDFMSTNTIPIEAEYKEYFYVIMEERLKRNSKEMLEIIRKNVSKNINNLYSVRSLYGMSFQVNFDKVLERFIELMKTYNISM